LPQEEAIVREAIRKIFVERMAPLPHRTRTARTNTDAEDARQRLHVAACALLLEIAYADDHFSDASAPTSAPSCSAISRSTRRRPRRSSSWRRPSAHEAIDLYQFTSLIRDSYDLGQKTLLAEIMWGLVLTDGAGRAPRELHAAQDREPAGPRARLPGVGAQARVAVRGAVRPAGEPRAVPPNEKCIRPLGGARSLCLRTS
jgi:uncharacterized tellurite resistance protein B-like protein